MQTTWIFLLLSYDDIKFYIKFICNAFSVVMFIQSDFHMLMFKS